MQGLGFHIAPTGANPTSTCRVSSGSGAVNVLLRGRHEFLSSPMGAAMSGVVLHHRSTTAMRGARKGTAVLRVITLLAAILIPSFPAAFATASGPAAAATVVYLRQGGSP